MKVHRVDAKPVTGEDEDTMRRFLDSVIGGA